MTKKTETPAATEEVPVTEQQTGLTINDLLELKNIIDVASSRGAFKTAEFTTIGQSYGKLVAFLTSVMPEPAEGAEAPAAPEAAPETEAAGA